MSLAGKKKVSWERQKKSEAANTKFPNDVKQDDEINSTNKKRERTNRNSNK
jgi:hypothetical protein